MMYTNLGGNLQNFLNAPWRIYTGGVTNGMTNYLLTNIYIFTNPPWAIYYGTTNNPMTNITNVIIGITNALGSNLVAALRPGLEHIKFLRTDYDSLLGQGYTPITNVYIDTIITNFIAVTQMVQRVITAPDILFAAQDLGTAQAVPNILTRSMQYINNDAVNGNTVHAGPGNLAPPVTITYSDILPGFENDYYPYNMSNSIRTMVWGSFKATMDVPITVYPDWISIQELEALIQSQ